MSDKNLYDDDDESQDEAQRVGNGPVTSPPNTKLENVVALGKDPKTRRVLIATVGAVVLVGALAAVSIVARNNRAPAQLPAAFTGASVGRAPTGLDAHESRTLAQSAQYQEIVAKAGQQRASEAAQSGQSTQPLAASVEASLMPSKTPAELDAIALKEQNEKAQAAALAEAQRRATEQAQRQASGQSSGSYQTQQPDPAYQQMMQNAQAAIAQLTMNRARGAQIYSMVDNVQGVVNQAGANGTQAQPIAVATASKSTQAQPYTLISAGLIESATMDTAVNTDVGGEFAATLVTGHYVGAKLIGSVQRQGELAQLTCKMISFPDQGTSVPASCVILDAESGEGGTATDVDRKLLTKYGIKPLAAGFAAVGEYLKSAGTTVVVNGATTVTTQPELTGKRAGQLVMGSAAQQVNTDANALSTTPTVRVRRGAVVGVFFTQDVIYTPKAK